MYKNGRVSKLVQDVFLFWPWMVKTILQVWINSMYITCWKLTIIRQGRRIR